MGGLIECLHCRPGYGKTPNNPEKRPAPCAAKYSKRERRVRASDKKKDSGMLNNPKNTLGLARGERVVERRCKVKKYHGRAEDARADNESSVTVLCCMDDEKRRSGECGDQSYSVANAVRNLFRVRLLTLGACKKYAHAISFQGLIFALTSEPKQSKATLCRD